MIITIDGPCASGKSSTARIVAQTLGYYYVYTGLLYRAIAYLLIHEGQYTSDQLANPREQDIKKYCDPDNFVYTYDVVHKDQIYYVSTNITPFLHGPASDQAASIVSANPMVRRYMLELQRSIAATHNVVIDGRDAGSVVFPYADYKFFLTASLDVRALRWLKGKQIDATNDNIMYATRELELRDQRDITRACAPLIIPQGAVVIDNSELFLQQTVNVIVDLVQK